MSESKERMEKPEGQIHLKDLEPEILALIPENERKEIGEKTLNDPIRKETGETILALAVHKRDINLVKKLLKMGADPNIHCYDAKLRVGPMHTMPGMSQDSDPMFQNTLLNMAVANNDYVLVKVLLESPSIKTNIDQKGSLGNPQRQMIVQGVTPLMVAISQGNASIVELLLTAKPNLTVKNGDDQTALDIIRSSVINVFPRSLLTPGEVIANAIIKAIYLEMKTRKEEFLPFLPSPDVSELVGSYDDFAAYSGHEQPPNFWKQLMDHGKYVTTELDFDPKKEVKQLREVVAQQSQKLQEYDKKFEEQEKMIKELFAKFAMHFAMPMDSKPEKKRAQELFHQYDATSGTASSATERKEKAEEPKKSSPDKP